MILLEPIISSSAHEMILMYLLQTVGEGNCLESPIISPPGMSVRGVKKRMERLT
jgi:hypothetical protein